jgi:hypothetical protein
MRNVVRDVVPQCRPAMSSRNVRLERLRAGRGHATAAVPACEEADVRSGEDQRPVIALHFAAGAHREKVTARGVFGP